MSNYTAKFLLVVSFLVLGGISAANAQVTGGMTLKVDIPNSFIIDNHTYPAGEYTISPTPSTIDSSTLLILRGKGEAAIFDTIKMDSAEAAPNTELVFDKIDDRYFLSKILIKGETTGNEITRTKSEKRLIAAAKKKEMHTVDVTGF